MDTLVIVRRIREAEALADAGKHGDARRALEPLLKEDGLTDGHRKLVGKKIDLFNKQHERMTRIISRRATNVSVRGESENAESNKSSERTAIRKPIDDSSRTERPTDHTPDKEDPTERPTNRTKDMQARGAPTEVVPRARDVDTEVPERGSKLKKSTGKKQANQSSGMWDAVTERREVVRPVDPSDSQELAPVADSDHMKKVGELDQEDTRATDIFVIPPEPVGAKDSQVQVAPEDDSAPVIGRFKTDSPVYPTGNDTPAPGWNDTPIPSADTPAPKPAVHDSFVIPNTDTVVSPALPDKDEDSNYLLADDYFNRPIAKRRERSNPELKALADRLPDDDLRRELALEVVRLREELKNSTRVNIEAPKSEPTKRETSRLRKSRSTTPKIEREDRPESGSFHIPASQVNTIVRRAAGTDQIEVHMPDRDEDAEDLQVLRRDSVRGEKAPQPTDRIALAKDYIEATQIEKPGLLKPLATWLGVLVILGVIAWAIHLAYQSVSGAKQSLDVSETQLGVFELGTDKSVYPDIAGKDDIMARTVRSKQGWLVQYDESKHLTAIVVPGPQLADADDSGFNNLRVSFNGEEYLFAQGTKLEDLQARFGGPSPEFSRQVWDSSPMYTLKFNAKQGQSTLEVCYSTTEPESPLWVRLVNGRDAPPPPAREDFKP